MKNLPRIPRDSPVVVPLNRIHTWTADCCETCAQAEKNFPRLKAEGAFGSHNIPEEDD